MPLFSRIVLKLPYLERHFRFLQPAVESYNDLQNYRHFCPKYFTLPIEVLRKRNCHLAMKSCISVISKNSVDFDLIHAHFLENGFIGAYLKNLYNKPLIVTAHGGDVYDLPFRNYWYNSLARFVLSEADEVITVSKFNAEKLLSLGVSSNKLHVIPNGYDERLFKPIPAIKARKKLGLPLNKKILLSVGNLVDAKGHIYLIGAMSLLLRKRRDLLLIIVGSGPLKKLLQSMVKKNGLEDHVMLAGGRRHEEIPIWMNASDIFILPSLQEGFPTVIPEAMACGKPVVATKVGGVPEAITSDYLGILVPPKDSESLSWAILEVLDKKWDPNIILEHAKKYSWSELAKQILLTYRKALNKA
ncbi:MAG: glycosyltransferase family 4 protein [Candidatus Verstraetearchaeota archaeon]|nr:glycosyltransferase family 4 protein [Candidatus Verstraetearchaeota archaeon]